MQQSVLIAGGSGLIGKRLTKMLVEKGYTIHILSRSKRQNTDQIHYFQWDFASRSIDIEAVKVDHIINLTGAGIADKRWTAERKKILIDSRVVAADLIKKGLAKSRHHTKSYLSASAIGYYGDRNDSILTTDSSAGQGFMADCCVQWEQAAQTLSSHTDRLVINRVGIVLSHHGGALPKVLMTKPMLSYFGSGSQYYSWIHIDDVCRVFIEGIENDSFSGVYNAVAPTPLTNKSFVSTIRNVLGGFVVPAPTFALRLVLGEMANVVLNSTRVTSNRLSTSDFEWKYSDLKNAILDIEKRKI